MLQECSKKRPDIYFELNKHCIIVEIDENQHNSYQNSCECARINEIVNGTACIEKALLFLFTTTALKNETLFHFLMV
jgi:hypothetical protein